MTDQDARQICMKALERTEADMLVVVGQIAESPDEKFTEHLCNRLSAISNGRTVLRALFDHYAPQNVS